MFGSYWVIYWANRTQLDGHVWIPEEPTENSECGLHYPNLSLSEDRRWPSATSNVKKEASFEIASFFWFFSAEKSCLCRFVQPSSAHQFPVHTDWAAHLDCELSLATVHADSFALISLHLSCYNYSNWKSRLFHCHSATNVAAWCSCGVWLTLTCSTQTMAKSLWS